MTHGAPWAVIYRQDEAHIIPLDDLRNHKVGVDCWCGPTPEADRPDIVAHHSLDRREEYETGRRLQ